MAIQIIPQAGSLSSQLGAGFAKGLGETIPKGMEQGYLAGTIRNLASQPGLSLAEQAAQLMRVPGMDSQKLNTLLPLLQQEQIRREAIGADGGQSAMQPEQPQQQEQGIQALPMQGRAPGIQQTQAQDRFGAPSEREGKARVYGLPASEQELLSKRNQLMRDQPARFRDPEKAMAEATRLDSIRVQNESKIRGEMDRSKELFQDSMSRKIQKKGNETFGDILGNLQDKFRIEAEKAVERGELSPEEAANKFSTQALNFAKDRMQLKKNASWWNTLFNPSSLKSSLENMRKKYDDYDLNEEFKDDLKTFYGLTEPYAAYIANPVKGNKEINNYISNLKPYAFGSIREKGLGNRSLLKAKSEGDIASFVAKNLKPTDSVQSIALALEGRGYNRMRFLEALKNLRSENKLALTKEQDRALDEVSSGRSIGDISLYIGMGLDKLLEQA